VRTGTCKYKCIVRVANHQNAEKKVRFTESLEAQYPFLKEDQQVGKVLCSICKSQFPTEHGGCSGVLQHKEKRKHAAAAETKSCSKKVTSYFTKETITDECKHIAAAEGLFAPHTIKYNHSLRFMDRKSSVIRGMHEEKFSCGRTKSESTVVNVLAPFPKQQILEELESVKHLTVTADASNHKTLKSVSLLVRHFTPKKRVHTKVT
jgi:hypothetical protein